MHGNDDNKKTTLESVAGHPITGPLISAATTLGSISLSGVGAPFLGVIPGLIGSLALGRMENRINETLKLVKADLQSLEEKMHQATDNQLTFLLGSVSSMFSTVDPAKLEILRKAAIESIKDGAKVEGDAAAIARTIQNLTAPEASFLAANFGKMIMLSREPGKGNPPSPFDTDPVWLIDPQSEYGQLTAGLSAQGILVATQGSWEADRMIWTHLGKQVFDLISPESTPT